MKQSLWVTISQWFVNLYRAQRYYRMLGGIAACATRCNCCEMLSELAHNTINGLPVETRGKP